jgi:glutamine amidotransferase
MTQLDQSGLRPALEASVTEERKPVLGICVGMQLLANASEEGNMQGLGWVRGRVRKFDVTSVNQLPHMGWNRVEPVRVSELFSDVDFDPGCYFLHSYYFECEHESDALATTWYGGRFTSAVNRNNVFGVQFHPEKSHHAGTKLLENFSKLK